MAKLWLSILLVLVSLAYCRSDSSIAASPSTATSVAPTPSPTPAPPQLPGEAPNFPYNLTNNVTKLICIRMNASLGLVVYYTNNKNEQVDNIAFNINPQANVSNGSFCNESTLTANVFKAKLGLEWQYLGGNGTYTMDFHLTENQNQGQDQWNVTSVNVTIPVKANPYFPSQPKQNVVELSAGYGDLVESLDFKRSYFCNSSRLLSMMVSGGNEVSQNFNVSLNITNFQIQAFQFTNTTSYEYGNALRCSQDIQGSKLVPIIVGAALAGLVIIVLIAYIIGRYRSRKHNSYEALS